MLDFIDVQIFWVEVSLFCLLLNIKFSSLNFLSTIASDRGAVADAPPPQPSFDTC